MDDVKPRAEIPLDAEELAALDDTARDDQPALFALYGTYRRGGLPGQPPVAFLGWGLEFPAIDRAIMWVPGGQTWTSSSALSLLSLLNRITHARLRWLDGRPDAGPIAA